MPGVRATRGLQLGHATLEGMSTRAAVVQFVATGLIVLISAMVVRRLTEPGTLPPAASK